MRWKIETFHKILKSGCKAEEVKLRTAERIVNLIAVLCILSWRVFWMTMLSRALANAAPEMALTATEIYLLDQLVSDKADARPVGNTVSLYLTKLARLGGYLPRAKDPPPGNTVMWRGLSRLTDIQLGFFLAPPPHVRVHHLAHNRARTDNGHLHHDVIKLARRVTHDGGHLCADFHLKHTHGCPLKSAS